MNSLTAVVLPCCPGGPAHAAVRLKNPAAALLCARDVALSGWDLAALAASALAATELSRPSVSVLPPTCPTVAALSHTSLLALVGPALAESEGLAEAHCGHV